MLAFWRVGVEHPTKYAGVQPICQVLHWQCDCSWNQKFLECALECAVLTVPRPWCVGPEECASVKPLAKACSDTSTQIVLCHGRLSASLEILNSAWSSAWVHPISFVFHCHIMRH
jgi:hypothetical protein